MEWKNGDICSGIICPGDNCHRHTVYLNCYNNDFEQLYQLQVKKNIICERDVRGVRVIVTSDLEVNKERM